MDGLGRAKLWRWLDEGGKLLQGGEGSDGVAAFGCRGVREVNLGF